ncbi:MAG: hypothetical protein IKB25_01790 [Lentisphaeria bacterium]|nr:hypothetical protein [Lentisphaeria bacterium]
MIPKKSAGLSKLFDFWSVQNIIVIFILKILQFFRNIGAKAESAGWRKVTEIFVRNEYSKFILTAFRLKYTGFRPKSEEQAKAVLFQRLKEFIREKPQLNWAVRIGNYSFKRRRIHVCDIMEAEMDSSGNIRKIIPHFDERIPVTHFLQPQINFILRHITVVYNTMRYQPSEVRIKRIEKALKIWISAHSGYNILIRRHLHRLVDRIMSSVFVFCDVKPGRADGKTPSRFHIPDLRRVRHPGWGMLCIAARFSEDLDEVDLWWQFSHVTADGAPMQEIMNQLKAEWGTVGELTYPPQNHTISIPNIVYCGDNVFRARAFIDFSMLQNLRNELNQKWEKEMQGKATLAGIFLWGISAHPFLRDKKILVPVDMGVRDGERELGLLVIRPGKFRKNSPDELSGFLEFHKEFSRKMNDIREGHGVSEEFLQLCTMLHPFFYHAAKLLAPSSLSEILGTVGFSMIRDAEMFVSPFTDFQVNGFLTLGNVSIPTLDGKKAGSLCICGDKKRIRRHLEALRFFLAEPQRFFSKSSSTNPWTAQLTELSQGETKQK